MLSRSCSDDLRLPAAARIGTGAELAKDFSKSPPPFNYLHGTPEDHLQSKVHGLLDGFHAENRRLGSD